MASVIVVSYALIGLIASNMISKIFHIVMESNHVQPQNDGLAMSVCGEGGELGHLG